MRDLTLNVSGSSLDPATLPMPRIVNADLQAADVIEAVDAEAHDHAHDHRPKAQDRLLGRTASASGP